MSAKLNTSIWEDVVKCASEYWAEVLFLFVFFKITLVLGMYIF